MLGLFKRKNKQQTFRYQVFYIEASNMFGVYDIITKNYVHLAFDKTESITTANRLNGLPDPVKECKDRLENQFYFRVTNNVV